MRVWRILDSLEIVHGGDSSMGMLVANGVAWFSISKGKMPCPLLGYRGIPISGAGCVGFQIWFLGGPPRSIYFLTKRRRYVRISKKEAISEKKGGRPPFLGEVLYCVWQASIYNGQYVPEDLPDLL
ncbi:uncharacterized protein K444DRAFT_300957 [Hyaloscypha bicolor E]|uniref:Uncharacterized protein n=1 Tax=Hyaloscypha bicolor E TaxID=1095630 RepID=A0A2J6SFG5_9HELO|nr:uncharacterized protein K444DRAFT_300957 [Hyaloscypha bicolor E]PMD49507.1 hypothetical protein K444DRAFT_300957 [Hyaloscypha bicolor E]